MKIVVLAGGISTEREVSLTSGKMIYKALKKRGHQAILLDVFLGLQGELGEDVGAIFEKDEDWAKEIGSISAKNPDIEKLYNEGYEIRSWTCGTDRIESYKKMSDKYHDQAHLADDFEMIEIKRSDEDISATKARQALLDDDKKTFASLTPLVKIADRGDVYNQLREQLLKVVKV